MRILKLIIALVLILSSCSSQPATGNFGEKFEASGEVDFKQALASFEAGRDTTYVITGTIESVCQGEGCWISFKNDSTEFLVNTHERFTMPKNSKGKKATAKGKFVRNEEGEVEFSPDGVIIE